MPDLARVPLPLDALLAQLEHALCSALRRGATRAQAAAVVGWTEGRLADVLARGELPDAPPALVRLAQSVRAAEVAYELSLLDALAAAALAGDRAAAVWLLERRRPGAGPTGAPEASSFTGDELRAMSDEQLNDIADGRPPRGWARGQTAATGVVILPPEDPEGSAPLVQRDLERMTGEQLRALVRQGRLMPAGPAIYIPPEADE